MENKYVYKMIKGYYKFLIYKFVSVVVGFDISII